jgi:hypothetical protein
MNCVMNCEDFFLLGGIVVDSLELIINFRYFSGFPEFLKSK